MYSSLTWTKSLTCSESLVIQVGSPRSSPWVMSEYNIVKMEISRSVSRCRLKSSGCCLMLIFWTHILWSCSQQTHTHKSQISVIQVYAIAMNLLSGFSLLEEYGAMLGLLVQEMFLLTIDKTFIQQVLTSPNVNCPYSLHSACHLRQYS